MAECEILPLEGVPPVYLGMTKAEARHVLGRPEGTREPDRWFFGHFPIYAIDFNTNNEVCYIETTWKEIDGDKVYYQGINLLGVSARQAVRTLATESRVFVSEGGITVDLPELGLVLWRSDLPTDHEYDEPENEYRNGKYWTTVGVTTEAYVLDLIDRFGGGIVNSEGRRVLDGQWVTDFDTIP